jgi:hypothetical protein
MLLTRDQVLEYELPATEGKRGDPRWPGFARRYDLDPARPVQWEVEALEPDELQRLVLAAVDPYIDRAVLERRSPARKNRAVPWPTSSTAGARRVERLPDRQPGRIAGPATFQEAGSSPVLSIAVRHHCTPVPSRTRR